MKPIALRYFVGIALTAECLIVPVCLGGNPAQVLNRPQNGEVYSLAFSPDGKVLAVGSSADSALPGTPPDIQRLPEGTIELWELSTGRLASTFRQSAWSENGDTANRVGTITFSPDGKSVVGGDMIGYSLWDIRTGKEKFRWRSGVMGPELSPGWSSDGCLLVLPSMELGRFELTNGIAVIEVATGKRTAFFPVEVGYARSARISPDGKLVATAGHDCTVRVFDLAAHTNIFRDFVQTTMYAACFSPDGRYLVAGSSWGGTLLLYEIASKDAKQTITKKGKSSRGAGELHHVEFAPDGKQAFSNSYGAIGLWDTTTWTSPKSLPGCYGRLSPDGARVALAREAVPNFIEIWSLDELAKAMELK